MAEQPEMRSIPLADIDLGDRARTDYHDVRALWRSIQEKGIIQPIAVMRRSQAEKPFLLLAGGRRYMAHVYGEALEIPARIYKEGLSPLEIKEIELMENLEREDLSYSEEVALKKEIHQLMVAKEGEAHGPSEGHSIRDTAKILGESPSITASDIELAKAIEESPELASLKNKTEARRRLQRLKREALRKIRLDLHQETIKKGRADVLKERLINAYIVADFFEAVRDIPAKTVDCVEIDPPYGIDLAKLRHNDTDRLNLERYNEIDAREYKDFLARLLAEAYRVLKDDGWLLMWFAVEPWQATVLQAIRQSGLACFGLPAIWTKPGATGQTRDPNTRLGSVYEPFYYARKGSAVLFKPGRNNIFSHRVVAPGKKEHPTERPVELLMEVLSVFCPPSGYVLVPFAGSGNTLLAAYNLGMRATGFDLCQAYKDAYTERILEDTLGPLGKFSSY